MSNENGGGKGGQRGVGNEGWAPLQKGYKPAKGNVTGGHKPEKSELQPTNPPKKR